MRFTLRLAFDADGIEGEIEGSGDNLIEQVPRHSPGECILMFLIYIILCHRQSIAGKRNEGNGWSGLCGASWGLLGTGKERFYLRGN